LVKKLTESFEVMLLLRSSYSCLNFLYSSSIFLCSRRELASSFWSFYNIIS